MELLFGKPISDRILSTLKADIALERQKPGLAVILVGNDEASKIYVGLKEKRAKEIGMNFFLHEFDEKSSEEEILDLIKKLNNDEQVHGIIVQLPLPAKFDTEKIISSIVPRKDADGFHPKNSEIFMQGGVAVLPVFPRAIGYLIESSGINLKEKNAVIISNSHEFGSIMKSLLLRMGIGSQYVLVDGIGGKSREIAEADVVVSAVGSPGLLRGEMLKNGSIVIDGGIEKVGEKVMGDVDFASTEGKNGFITPVPGGVGPVTIACLLENTFLAFKAQQKEE